MVQPRVGVASLVINEGRLLLGRRNKFDEALSWQLPGGFMAQGESVFQAAVRLAEAKAGVVICPLQQGPFTNNIFPDQSHTVSLYVLAELQSGQSKDRMADGWQWFALDDLPEPLFLPLQLLLVHHSNWLESVVKFK